MPALALAKLWKPLSIAALIVLGASDMVSVYVRATLIQLATPDAMRGRVSAVNMVFIGASNELGEFESGLTAQWFGAVPSVVLGGVVFRRPSGVLLSEFPLNPAFQFPQGHAHRASDPEDWPSS